jgi:hypothetical protein
MGRRRELVMAGINKRPVYWSDDTREEESAFFEATPKHVLYALLRDFAAFADGDSAEESWSTASWIKLARDHATMLREQHLIK